MYEGSQNPGYSEAHELAYDEPLGAFIWDRLEDLAAKRRTE